MAVDGPLHILFVEDVASDAELAARELHQSGLDFSWDRVDSAQALREALTTRSPDLIISDYSMPTVTGMEALSMAMAHDPALPFIVLTAGRNDVAAVECLKAGAWDYVVKERRTRLPYAVREALTRRRAMLEASKAHEALQESERRYRTLADSGRALIWTSASTASATTSTSPGWTSRAGPSNRNWVTGGPTASIRTIGARCSWPTRRRSA